MMLPLGSNTNPSRVAYLQLLGDFETSGYLALTRTLLTLMEENLFVKFTGIRTWDTKCMPKVSIHCITAQLANSAINSGSRSISSVKTVLRA